MWHLPPGSGRYSRLRDFRARGSLETVWPLAQIFYGGTSLHGYLHIWYPLVAVRLTQTPKNPPILGLLEMNPT